MASEMVERVIKAMKDEVFGRGHDMEGHKFDMGEIDFLVLARVAIEAMRQPRFELADAIQGILAEYRFEDGELTVSRKEAGEILGKIIDAALKD